MLELIDTEASIQALEAVAVAAKESIGRAMEIKLLTSRPDNPDVWDEVCAIAVALRAALAKLEEKPG